MRFNKHIAAICIITLLITSIAVYANVGNDSGTTVTLDKSETVSCGEITAAGCVNPIIDLTVASGNGGVTLKVLKNNAIAYTRFVPDGGAVTVDLTIDAQRGDEIKFSMTPEVGKTPIVTYNYSFGDKYNPINTGRVPQDDNCTVKSQKTLGQYIADAANGNVYVMYNYKRIPMTKSGNRWYANLLTEYETGSLGAVNNRPKTVVWLTTTAATLGAYGGTPNIDVPVTEDGVIKISGEVPGIAAEQNGVYKGVVTNIYKNDNKVWSSRVGDYQSVRYDDGYKNSYFNEYADVVIKVKAGDIITFSFDSWHTEYGYNYTADISDINIAYIDGDPMGESAKRFFKNSDVYDTKSQLIFKNGELLCDDNGVQRVDMISEDGKFYIAADEIGRSVNFANVPIKEETKREKFDYPDSGIRLGETYKPFYISGPIGQIKDGSLAYIGTENNPTAQFIMNAEEFNGASNPMSDGVVTYEFRCGGKLDGDISILFGRGEGTNTWWENGIRDGLNSKLFRLHDDFSCEANGGTKVTPVYKYSDDWYRVKIDVDISNRKAYMSVNDVTTGAMQLPTSWDVKDFFRIQLRKNMTTGEDFRIDDAKITYTEGIAENSDCVECVIRNDKTYYNICGLISANGKSFAVADDRFIVVFDGVKNQISYSDISRITARLSDDAVITEYGTKIDFDNMPSRIRVSVRLFEEAVDSKETTVILAGYKDDTLVYAERKKHSVSPGEDLAEEFFDIDNSLDYDTISVFVWGGYSNMIPEANSEIIEK